MVVEAERVMNRRVLSHSAAGGRTENRAEAHDRNWQVPHSLAQQEFRFIFRLLVGIYKTLVVLQVVFRNQPSPFPGDVNSTQCQDSPQPRTVCSEGEQIS